MQSIRTMQSITLIDTVIDTPEPHRIKDMVALLKRATIEGHRVLHVDYLNPADWDVIEVPHVGHSGRCHEYSSWEGERLPECVAKEEADGRKITRYMNVRIIVEGSLGLADVGIENTRRTIWPGTLLNLVMTAVKPQVAESDRYELEAWND